MQVVIGAGPDGLRAAAAYATAGAQVLLLQETEQVHGRAAPHLPEGTGRMRMTEDQRAWVEQVIGSLVEAPDVRRAVLARGAIHALPLSKRAVAQLFQRQALPEVGHRWLGRRLRNALSPFTGEGREERSYQDWVVRRMGEPVFRHVYADYAQSRFGAAPDALSCSVARVHHGDEESLSHSDQVAGGGPEQSLAFAAAAIESGGGEVRTGVSVLGLVLEQGRVRAVRTEGGDVPVEGLLWIARPPARIAHWLGDGLDAALRYDAAQLHTADAVQVALRGGPEDLPDELHLIGDQASFYRVVTSYGGKGHTIFHATVEAGAVLDPGLPARMVVDAARLGLAGFEEAGAVVERLRDHVPIWTERCHARLRRLVLAWEALGIVTVGRQGTFTPMDIASEVVWARSMAASENPDQREGLRALLEPPVIQADLGASISRFVVR